MGCLNILESLAVITASLVAIWGINSWRKEIRGRRQYELAEEVLSLFYDARDKISGIRSIFGYIGEGESRRKEPNETPEEEKVLNDAFVVFERYQKNQETFNKLHALRYRFMAIFGKDKVKPFDDLDEIVNQIFIAARMLGRLWHMITQTYSPRSQEEYEKIINDIGKYEAIFWDMRKDPDPINPKVESVISGIDKICEPILRGEPSKCSKIVGWISRIFSKRKNKVNGSKRN